MTEQVVEARMNCKCVHLDPEYAGLFGYCKSPVQYLIETRLPAVENRCIRAISSTRFYTGQRQRSI